MGVVRLLRWQRDGYPRHHPTPANSAGGTMRRFRTTTLLCALVLCIVPAHAASFSCAQTATPIERQVCGDTNLSALDEKLATAYKRVLELSPAPEDTKEVQRRWVRGHRDQCKTVECLAGAYNSRIQELAALAARLPFQPDTRHPSVVLAAQAKPDSIAVPAKPLKRQAAELIGRIEFAHDAAGGRWDFSSGKKSFTVRYVWQVTDDQNKTLERIANSGSFVLVRGRLATAPGGETLFDDTQPVFVYGARF
jgi:uncharacterized protein